MKALIVDDERHVREAIRLLVDWQAYGITEVFEAQDADSAIGLIGRENPQIVFTDMIMPGKTGTVLLAWVREHSPRTKTIVISGHDDFDFVRKTVLYGGMDYILKPIDPEQLNEAVRKAAESRKRDDEGSEMELSKAIEINRLRPVYWDKILSNLIDDPSYYASIAETLHQEFGLSDEDRLCRAAVLATDTIHPSTRSKFAGSEDLLLFSLLNICNEIVRRNKSGVAFRQEHGGIVVLVWKRTQDAAALLDTVNDGIRQAFGSPLEFGVGGARPIPAGFKQSYYEAVLVLRQRNMRAVRPRIRCFDPDENPRLSTVHLSEFEDRLRIAVRSGREKPIREAVEQWAEQVERMGYINTEQLELWEHEYNVMKTRWLKELLGDLPAAPARAPEPVFLPAPVDADGCLRVPLLAERLERDLRKVAEGSARHERHEEHVIFEIVKYIEARYAEEITLQELADRFYLSREYISRKFKQQFRENLSDYIERVRMEKAKLLLLNPQYRIAQVAELVGYKDEKYFSKVFKKLEGASPNEYRKREASE